MIERYADRRHRAKVDILKKDAIGYKDGYMWDVEDEPSGSSLAGTMGSFEIDSKDITNNESADAILSDVVGGNTRRRHREESPEEQALRRRRREAIVLNEGDRPLSQRDIIQRQTTG